MTMLGAIPEPPQARSITVPGGATLTGMVELPAGATEQCKVTFNLLLQLGPIFANLECPLLRTLRFVTWLIEFVQLIPGVISNPTKVSDLVTMTDKLTSEILPDLLECLNAYLPTPLGLCPPIKGVLVLVRDFLQCTVDLMDSIFQQQLEIGIQMENAQGNPQLLEVLELAQKNMQNTFQQSVQSCEPVFTLLQSIGGLVSAVGGGAIEIPSLGQVTGTADEIGQVTQVLKDLIAALTAIIDILPC